MFYIFYIFKIFNLLKYLNYLIYNYNASYSIAKKINMIWNNKFIIIIQIYNDL